MIGRTIGIAGTAKAIGIGSTRGGLPDTGTDPPRTSCSKLQKVTVKQQRQEITFRLFRTSATKQQGD